VVVVVVAGGGAVSPTPDVGGLEGVVGTGSGVVVVTPQAF